MQNFKLDKIDFRILRELDSNSRQSFTKIARHIKRTPQEVKRRYDILVEQGIIRYCWPMVEYRHVGHFFLVYLLKLHNLSQEKEKELFTYFNSINEIPIIMRGDGYFDVFLAICARGMFHAEKIFQKINAQFSQYIMRYEAVIPIGFSQFRRNYLVGKKMRTEKVAFTGDDVGSLGLKPDTLHVLELLNQNARISIQEISDKLGMGYDKAKGNVRRLEKLGVIQSYTYLLDHQRLGFPRHRVLLQLFNLTPMQEENFFSYCNLHPHIIHYLRLLGAWQLALDIETKNRQQLREILREIKLKFANIVYRIEPTEIYAIDRFRDIPEKLTK